MLHELSKAYCRLEQKTCKCDKLPQEASFGQLCITLQNFLKKRSNRIETAFS